MEIIRATVSDPLTADQPFAFGYFLVHAACPVSFWTANLEAVSEYLSILLNVELGTAASHWQRVGRFYERVLGFLQKAGNQNARGWDALVTDPSLTPFQADSLSTFDRRLLCAQSLARATDGVVNWCTAEVLRARGEALLTGGNADAWPEAEKLFLRAIDVSRGQGALSWDLRSATSLARLANLKGGVGDARKLLTEVYERFTEGYSTPDLVEAKAVLESLP